MSLDYRNGEALNILFVSHDAHPNGAQYALLTLTTWLKEIGLMNPRFIMAGPGTLFEEFLRVGPVLRLVHTNEQAESDPVATMRLLRSFCGNDVSGVYLNSAASGHIIEATRHLNVPHVAHIHELEKSIERFAGVDKMASLLAHAEMFIAASRPVAENLHLKHGVPRDKLKIVHSFIRCTGMRDVSDAEKRSSKAALGLNPEAKVVLGCGTTDWRKGPDLFIEVAAQLRTSQTQPVQFVWVGGQTNAGERVNLEQLVESYGLRDSVTFVGEVATPLPYMIASDVFLLSSREDPFPLVCLESADVGLPIICFADAGGMPDFVGSTCGVVVPYLDVRRMADELKSLLMDREKARLLGTGAKREVRRSFDVTVKGPEIANVLAKLCSPAAAAVGCHK
jgi:glycosyltransferase involved in cell wall biosynthesis